MLRNLLLSSSLLVSSVGFAVTEADIIKAESDFAEHEKNVEFFTQHLTDAASQSGINLPAPTDGSGNVNPSPWYGQPEAWTDLVVALRTLQNVTKNARTAMGSLKLVVFNPPVLFIRHTAICSQFIQINTAWTALEFGEATTLPFQFHLGSQYYQDARATIDIISGPAGLQCP